MSSSRWILFENLISVRRPHSYLSNKNVLLGGKMSLLSEYNSKGDYCWSESINSRYKRGFSWRMNLLLSANFLYKLAHFRSKPYSCKGSKFLSVEVVWLCKGRQKLFRLKCSLSLSVFHSDYLLVIVLTTHPDYAFSFPFCSCDNPLSLIIAFAGHSVVVQDPKCLQADIENSEKHARIHSLVGDFAWRTCNLVGNAVPRLR